MPPSRDCQDLFPMRDGPAHPERSPNSWRLPSKAIFWGCREGQPGDPFCPPLRTMQWSSMEWPTWWGNSQGKGNFPYPRQFSLWELKHWTSSGPQPPCPSTLGLAPLPKRASCMLLPSGVLAQEEEVKLPLLWLSCGRLGVQRREPSLLIWPLEEVPTLHRAQQLSNSEAWNATTGFMGCGLSSDLGSGVRLPFPTHTDSTNTTPLPWLLETGPRNPVLHWAPSKL